MGSLIPLPSLRRFFYIALANCNPDNCRCVSSSRPMSISAMMSPCTTVPSHVPFANLTNNSLAQPNFARIHTFTLSNEPSSHSPLVLLTPHPSRPSYSSCSPHSPPTLFTLHTVHSPLTRTQRALPTTQLRGTVRRHAEERVLQNRDDQHFAGTCVRACD